MGIRVRLSGVQRSIFPFPSVNAYGPLCGGVLAGILASKGHRDPRGSPVRTITPMAVQAGNGPRSGPYALSARRRASYHEASGHASRPCVGSTLIILLARR